MKRTVLIAALLLGFAIYLFGRPFSVPCPIDGEAMHWTGQQQGAGSQQSCEYAHDAWSRTLGN